MNLQLCGRLLFVVLVATATACTKSKPVSEVAGDHQDIFSNRPINAVPDVFMITLNAPAILAGGNKADILNEQTQFEQKLKDVSAQAQIIFRYRMTLNAIAVYAPADIATQISGIAGVKNISVAREMGRPRATDISATTGPVQKVNSSTFIGVEEAYAQGFTGRGMRVGVLDTGVDYTHKMLGGSGLKDDFLTNNPSQPNALFPNAKVVGGIDLAGTEFNAASAFNEKHVPKPDANPIDEAGHGTHVAGTIAGIGDGVNSFDGVAKDAQIYAIKVFGAEGSTMDAVVIAGFEFSADPNGDLNPIDHLDVINLSLGGGFGQPQILYTEAIKNLSRAGTVVVCSAGNSGPVDYIVGAPGTSDEALSVAASIDGSPHNWQFSSVRFVTATNPNLLTKAVEGPISKPIAELMAPVEGELVDIGFADSELSEDVKLKLSGKIAFISRGKVNFAQKLELAFKNGAIGAVVYNNDASKPIPMGGNGKFEIPAVMISQALGMGLLGEMKTGAVKIQFVTNEKIEQPELIDSITDFSSKGPRSQDNLLKPEIAAPGSRVISAAMGEGTKTVQMDGTSMAAPHMTGAMALIKQARPQLSSSELKSLAMSSSKILSNKDGIVATTLQGAGRVQVDQALRSPVVIEPPALSLGGIAVQDTRTEVRKLSLRNFTAQDVTLDLTTEADAGLALSLSQTQVSLPAGGSVEVTVNAVFTLTSPQLAVQELDGRVKISQNGKLVAQVPALAIRTQASMIRTNQSTVTSGPITLTNSSPVTGMALAFNLLGEDAQKTVHSPSQSWKSRGCDLQSVGYRIVKKQTARGEFDYIQFGFKLFAPLTTWHICEVSVLIDADGDGVADQELAGVSSQSIEGLGQIPFASVLLDAAKARAIRLAYEQEMSQGTEGTLDYTASIIGGSQMAPFEHSSLTVIEAPLMLLARSADGKLNIKVASLAQGSDSVEADDFLGADLGSYMKIESTAAAQPFFGMSEFSAVPKAGGFSTVSRGATPGKLILYYPMNPITAAADSQFQILD